MFATFSDAEYNTRLLRSGHYFHGGSRGVRRVYNTSGITRRMSITILAIHVERKIKSNPDVDLLVFIICFFQLTTPVSRPERRLA